VIHAVDEGNAVTLVFEDRVGKGLPTVFLTLIKVGWPLRRNLKSYGFGTGSNGYSGDQLGSTTRMLIGRSRLKALA